MRPTTPLVTAAALVATTLALLPGLTVNGIDEPGPALDSRLHEVASAADFLAACDRVNTPRPGATTLGLKGAAEASTGRPIGPGALLAAAVGLGIGWSRLGDTPHARLAVRFPPRWTRPTVEHVAQALRRLGGEAKPGILAGIVRDACVGPDGFLPPWYVIRAAVDAAVAEGVAEHDGPLVRLSGGKS